MSDDERVLRSFVAEDEELRDFRSITLAKRSKGKLPPNDGEETVAVTDERLLWFANELEEVPLDEIEEVELEYVEEHAPPMMVMGGGLVFVLGLFASIGSLIAGVGDTLVVAMPAMTGLAVFLGSRLLASLTGREGETRTGHRLRLWVDGDPISLWGEDERTMDRLRAAVSGEEGDSIDDESADLVDADDDDAVDEESDVPLQSTAATEADGDDGSDRRSEGDATAE